MKSSVRKINTQSLRNDSNVYVVKLAENGSTVFAGSRGASESQCESLAGTFVLMQVAEGRFWSVANALNNANDFSTPTSSGAIASQDCMGRLNATHFCTKCGKLLSALDAETHDCSSVCSVCGATLTAAEKAGNRISAFFVGVVLLFAIYKKRVDCHFFILLKCIVCRLSVSRRFVRVAGRASSGAIRARRPCRAGQQPLHSQLYLCYAFGY